MNCIQRSAFVAALLGLALGASAQVTNISYLRTLVDENYAATDTTNTYTVEGVVTTTNLTSSANANYYLQDATAGIALYAGGGVTPAIGDHIQVTGNLGQYNGLLEFSTASGPITVVTNSSGNPLPTPVQLDFNQLENVSYMETLESSYVVVSNVVFDQSSPTFATAIKTFTNEFGQTFVIYANGYTDIPGKPVPTGPATIVGVLGQFDSSSPYTSGYQIIPSSYADIITPIVPPIVEFTNTLSNLVRPGDAPVSTTFKEYALRPGETLTIDTLSYDADGSNIVINPISTGLPAGAQWTYDATTGTSLPATFSYTAQAGAAGNQYDVTLMSYSSRGTNTSIWSIYVPTAEEQNVVISEFLAGPTTDTNSLYWNPLNRPAPGSTNAFADDEFVEIVNNNSSSMDFIGWQLADAVQVRHVFYDYFTVGSSNAFILYGGQLNNDPVPPVLPGMFEPFSEGQIGVSVLNNGGDTISLYNLDENLVARVVYTNGTSANGISFTRYPTLTDDFVEHSSVVCTNVSPGLQPDQQGYDQPVVFANPPTVSEIADQSINQNSSTGPIGFTVGDPATPLQSLTLTGFSSNAGLVPNENIAFGGSGANRTVEVTPVAGQLGLTTISIMVGNDALRCTTTSFQLLVQATNTPTALFCDDFSYADGSLITNSSFIWTNHSGTVGQMQVSGGAVQVTFQGSEDVNRLIPDMPDSGFIYYSFSANFSELPSSSGGYFAHLKNDGTGFIARLFAQTTGAAEGKFRLGIGNTSSTSTLTQYPEDLDLGMPYRVTVRHDLGSGVSTLWIDAETEADFNVTTTDGASPISLVAMALRQASGIGSMAIDDLCVGTSFASVVPPAEAELEIQTTESSIVLIWSDPSFELQASPTVTGTFTNVPGATSPFTNTVSGEGMFFRLMGTP